MDWLNEALSLAQKAEVEGEVPIGAVVVHEGKIVGKGFNLREKTQNPLAHAELLAIYDASQNLGSWRLLGCSLFVTLEPCPMCLAACQQARLDEVIFGALDAKGGALSLGYLLNEDFRLNHRFKVTHSDRHDCGKILTEFFRRKRKRDSV